MVDHGNQEPTERRYLARQLAREASQRRLAAGGVLDADSPKRVRKRLQRLGLEDLPRRRDGGGESDLGGMDLEFERFVGRIGTVPVHFLERGLVTARAVGLVRLEDRDHSDGATAGLQAGTGILISSRLLLTARELIPDHGTAVRSSVAFQVQEDGEGRREFPLVFDFDPDSFLYTHLGLGFTVVAVYERSRTGEELTSLGSCSLIRDEGKAVIGERLSLIQHPDGGCKQISLRESRLVDVLPEHLHYQGAQAVGSPGAPVFNDQWEVVAIHTGGIARRDSRGRILDRDGRTWREEQGEGKIDWIMGEGVRVSRIARLLRRQTWPVEQRRLCAEVFEPALHPPWAWAPLRTQSVRSDAPCVEHERLDPVVPTGGVSGSGQPGALGMGLERNAAAEEMVWTVPVRIRLRVDPPQFHAPQSGPVGSEPGDPARSSQRPWTGSRLEPRCCRPERGESRALANGEALDVDLDSLDETPAARTSPAHVNRRGVHLSSTDQ